MALKDDDITLAERELKQQVLRLIEYLAQVKIVDAPVLMRLYDLYRLRL
jgi:hypothetical protein